MSPRVDGCWSEVRRSGFCGSDVHAGDLSGRFTLALATRDRPPEEQVVLQLHYKPHRQGPTNEPNRTVHNRCARQTAAPIPECRNVPGRADGILVTRG